MGRAMKRLFAIGLASVLFSGAAIGCGGPRAAEGVSVTKEVPFAGGRAISGDNVTAPPGNDNGPRVIPFRKGPPPQEIPPPAPPGTDRERSCPP